MQIPAVREAFDRRDSLSVVHQGQRQARVDAAAISSTVQAPH